MRRQSGFTLIELAIALVILGLIIGAALMPLSSVRDNTHRSDANRQLSDITEALVGFAQTQGRLPCPATATSNGAEAPAGGGNCTQQHGFIPITTLGLQGRVNDAGQLIDPWNLPVRYSVSDANANAFTSANGIKGGFPALNPNQRVCREAVCTNIIVDNSPAVVWSMGKNGASFTHADETQNNNNNGDFVSATYSEQNFDDIVHWLSPHLLYTRMIAAGQLP